MSGVRMIPITRRQIGLRIFEKGEQKIATHPPSSANKKRGGNKK